jgi:hypothetical protein
MLTNTRVLLEHSITTHTQAACPTACNVQAATTVIRTACPLQLANVMLAFSACMGRVLLFRVKAIRRMSAQLVTSAHQGQSHPSHAHPVLTIRQQDVRMSASA